MALYNTRAIVLRTIKLSETDKLVTFLTERHGKIKCAAKSARRIKSRFGAALEPLSYTHIIYFGKEYQDIYRLNNCDIIHSFQSIRENLAKLFTALYFNELVDLLFADGQNPRGFFQFLLESLAGIQKGLNMDTLCRLYEIRIMTYTGYAPRLDQCALCKNYPNGQELGYSFSRNGIVCQKCNNSKSSEIKIKAGTLNYVRKLAKIGIYQSERLKIPSFMRNEVELLTHRLIQYQLGREPKSYPFIKKIKL
tara:strand:- start:4426 stop:5178 length:753 start_codon:yes stop_codon:yes gene_type:complete